MQTIYIFLTIVKTITTIGGIATSIYYLAMSLKDKKSFRKAFLALGATFIIMTIITAIEFAIAA